MAKRKVKVQKVEGERRVGNTTADISGYEKTKSASGRASLDCGDDTAKQLRGLDLKVVYKLAAKATGSSERGLRDRYKHLNTGMQRMNLGNAIRGARQEA